MARIIVSTKRKEKTVPVNYKLQPFTKSINQLATEHLKRIAPESGMNYSEFIDDIFQAVLESDLVIYQIDDTKYTLKDILKKYFENQEDAIKKYIEDSMPSWIHENKNEIVEDIEGQGEGELEEGIDFDYDEELKERLERAEADIREDLISEDFEEDSDDFEDELNSRLSDEEADIKEELDEKKERAMADAVEDKYQETMDYGDGSELLYERIKDDIQVEFGPVFDVAEKIDINWARRLERYIEIVHEKQNLTMDHDLMTVIGVLFKNKILYMFNEEDVNLIYKDSKFKKNITENYINLRLLTDRILKDYGHLVFIETDEITIKRIVVDEALKDVSLKYIAKKVRYID